MKKKTKIKLGMLLLVLLIIAGLAYNFIRYKKPISIVDVKIQSGNTGELVKVYKSEDVQTIEKAMKTCVGNFQKANLRMGYSYKLIFKDRGRERVFVIRQGSISEGIRMYDMDNSLYNLLEKIYEDYR